MVGLVDENAVQVNTYEYSPFGKLTTESETVENPFKFSSEYFDSETNLVYYNYRYYDPENGKWLKRDPIEEKGGYNLYGFVGNNPIDYIDLLGFKPSSIKSTSWAHPSRAVQQTLKLSKWFFYYYGWYQPTLSNNRRGKPGLILDDVYNEMDSHLTGETELLKTGLLVYTSKLIDVLIKEGEWFEQSFNIIDIRPMMRLGGWGGNNIVILSKSAFDIGWWLSGAHRVDVKASFKYRKCGDKRQMKDFKGNFSWWDRIDANSFAIAYKKGSKTSGTLEGLADLLLENKVMDAGYDLKINFDMKQEKDDIFELGKNLLDKFWKQSKNELSFNMDIELNY
ncbi:RHS repeat-associated core domain-containing protein [Lentisphaerota bacterium WC36G]|nr:RHS repeat-associated core domain-containing protein [Lentisphaerae bacterium WC36]